MATQSPPPPNSSGENPPSPGSETETQNVVKMDAADESSEKPLLREDQVQNAVNFLSHPKVRGSPVVHRRSFLEKKGLTKEEIDEAFHRVPDQPSSAASNKAYITDPGIQQKSSTTLQHQGSVPQPGGAPIGVVSPTPSQQLSKFQWSHALLAAGALAASGAGAALLFKKMVIPRLKSWVKKVVAEESESEKDSPSSKLAEEATEAAKAAASAASAVAIASQELLITKSEERKYFEFFMGALDNQVKEMKSIGDAIRKLESRRNDKFSEDSLIRENISPGNGSINRAWRSSQVNQSDHTKVNGTSSTNFVDVRSAPQSGYVESSSIAHQSPYNEPWETTRQVPVQQRPSSAMQSQSSDERLSSKTQENYGHSDMPLKAYDASEPSWLNRNARTIETALEDEEWKKQLSARSRQRGWAPPPAPPVAIPEAADAIRRPKPLVQKQQSGDEQSIASSDDGKESEMRAPDAAATENPGSISGTSQSNIQEDGSSMDIIS